MTMYLECNTRNINNIYLPTVAFQNLCLPYYFASKLNKMYAFTA